MAEHNHLEDLRRVIQRHWGYGSFRPLQQAAMEAELSGRDSVVVMPTGGGKSLCYQAPAVVKGGTTVVVSPLISLMKDQVDGLRACGIPAAQIDSSLTSVERSAYEMDLVQGAVRLLFVSPERLAVNDFCRLLQRVDVTSFAIDEAHCISHWGHDFRPEYRQIGKIKELFPRASIHAYTATATEQVRQDICRQLNLHNPLVLVGSFDRPNLTYRVLPRLDETSQIEEVVSRHRNEAGIIYCIRRADVDDVNALLQHRGHRSLAYHAGLDKEERQRTQEAFASEQCDLIVATVAFGMGIDRSNIRFIVHAAMPKSIEHYQQETGRAGRDGLEAECVLLHGANDFMTWKRIMEKSHAESQADPKYLVNSLKHLEDMDRYCRGAVCRHRSLVQYFGQQYQAPVTSAEGETICGACDICLGDTEPVPDSLIVAQKILSCVARVEQRWGINHVVGVLRGEDTEKIRTHNHNQLTTYGLLKGAAKTEVRDWILQLVSQGVLVQEGQEFPVLKLNQASWEVMRKERTVRLIQPVKRKAEDKAKKSRADTESWEGVDRELFDRLRDLRKELATLEGVPPYIIYSDNTLREFARIRPSSLDKMRMVYGVGERKLASYGESFLKILLHYCESQTLEMDVGLPAPEPARPSQPAKTPAAKTVTAKVPLKAGSSAKNAIFELFRQGYVPEDVAHQTQRSLRVIMDNLAEFIRQEAPKDISQWLDDETYQRVAEAAKQIGTERLKPIFEALGGSVSYEEIRLVVAHLESQSPQDR